MSQRTEFISLINIIFLNINNINKFNLNKLKMGNCLSPKSGGKKEFVESKANVETLKALYEINMKVLGSGSYGKVFLAKNKNDPTI